MAAAITFYREWFPVEKEQFKVLCLAADVGEYRGNLTDMCRYFSVSPQSATRNRLRRAITALEQGNYLSVQHSGNNWTLTPVPKEKEIHIPREDYEAIRLRRRPEGGESVAWEAVLKVYLWIRENSFDSVITNAQIQKDLKLSPGVICSAKNVLDREFEAILRQYESKVYADGSIRRKGQHLGSSAFWNGG